MGENMSDLERELDSTELDDRSIWQKVKDFYFEPKGVERWNNGRIYEWTGMKKFKKVCGYIGRKMGKDHGRENNYFIWDKSEDGLREFEKKTRVNEGVHFVTTVFPAMCFIPGWIDGDPLSVYVGGVLIAINAYSLLLQRYNRSRIYNVLDRMEARNK